GRSRRVADHDIGEVQAGDLAVKKVGGNIPLAIPEDDVGVANAGALKLLEHVMARDFRTELARARILAEPDREQLLTARQRRDAKAFSGHRQQPCHERPRGTHRLLSRSVSTLLAASRSHRISASAAARMALKAIRDRSAMSSRLCSPSEQFRTQSNADSPSRPAPCPPMLPNSPRLPSCGSPFGLRFRYIRSLSSTSTTSKILRRLSASECGSTHSRSSAEVWYSGKQPCGVRERRPTGRLKPGEQY